MTAVPSPFEWSATFDVKHDELNEQHKKLFALINDLDHNRGDATKLNDLLGFVQFHFKTEEDLFEAKQFNDGGAHKAIHDKFVGDAVAATSGKPVVDATIDFLKNWLVNHICGCDMLYVGKL